MSRIQNLFQLPHSSIKNIKKMNLLPPYKVLSEQIKHDPEFKKLIHSKTDQKKFNKYLRELLPNTRATYLYLVQKTASLLIRAVFSRVMAVEVDNLKKLQELNKKYSLVFVANHRSNADYVVLGWTLLKYGITKGHEIANLKIDVFPFGTFFRSAGAFFVRQGERDFLYHEIISGFAHLLRSRKHNLTVFPEGGLSQNGSFRKLKTGFLTSFLSQEGSPVALVPVFINYDRIPEDRNLTHKKSHQPEHMRYFWNKLKVLAFIQNYRSAYIRFDDPILIEEVKNKVHVKEILKTIFENFSKNPILTPFNLMAEYLLAHPDRNLSEGELKKEFELKLEKYSKQIYFGKSTFTWFLKELFTRNILQKGPSGQIFLNPNEKPLLEYYHRQGMFEKQEIEI